MNYSDIVFVMRSAIMQVIVFSIIPFIWWIIKYKEEISFFKWIGLYKPTKLVSTKKIIIFITIYFASWIINYTISKDIYSNFPGMGVIAIIPSFIVCFIQNGLCEEILFRGFIGKRLISIFGKNKGIFIQAMLFGFMHIGMASLLDLHINISLIVNYFIIPTIGGWMLGYVDEKIYNGSIIPSILLHGLLNFGRDMTCAF